MKQQSTITIFHLYDDSPYSLNEDHRSLEQWQWIVIKLKTFPV